MKEIKNIIAAFDEAQQHGKQAVLATVVHVDGSSYRGPGARMLITETGELTGAISGGCLEGDALRKALHVMSRQKSMLVTYDTMDDDDAKLGVGLGCNGIIQVLIEPIDPEKMHNPVVLLKAISEQREPAVLATVFSLQNKNSPQPGTCLLVKKDSRITGQAPLLQNMLVREADITLQQQGHSFKNYISGNESFTVFFEYLKPPVSLIIAGAGNDVIPLVKMADLLGWETTVIDGRPRYAKKERFIAACEVVVSKPGDMLDKLVIDDQTVFLLMTHNYNYDLSMLRALVMKNPVYIGSLGPRKKMDRMLDDLKKEGPTLTPEQHSRLYGPVGLDIGAESSEEIALSVLAEIKAVLSDRQGRPLRMNEGSIHSRSQSNIEKVNIDHSAKY